MKNKKLISIICAAVFSIGAALVGCGGDSGGGDHEHSVGNWRTTIEPTCAEEGQRLGECVKEGCGEVIIESVPATPSVISAHNYGNWDITVPTDTATGTAVKTCSRNCTENHVRTVNLPVLSDSAYEVSVVKQASVNEEGEKSYKLTDDAGDIEFSVSVPKLGISSVGDAVSVGVYNAGLVREMHGYIQDTSLYTDYVKNTPRGREVGCYFGDGYVHVTDAEQDLDNWFSYDEEGNVFGVGTTMSGFEETAEITTKNIADASENHMQGYDFSMFHSEISGKFGAEGLLKGIYEVADDAMQRGQDVKYEEKLAEDNNGYYEFSFVVLTLEQYVELTVKFRLSSEGMLEELSVVEYAYERYKIGEVDENGEKIPEEGGHAEIAHYAGHVKLTQTPKKDSDVVPENKYDYKQKYVKSFKVMQGNKEVGGDKVAEIAVNQAAEFVLTDVLPGSAFLQYDEPEIFYRTASRDIPLSINPTEDGIIGYYTCEKEENSSIYKDVITIRSGKTGMITIVLKTRGMRLFETEEKVININVSKGVLQNGNLLVADHYEYDDADGETGHSWEQYAKNSDVGNVDKGGKPVYVGQTLIFKLGMDKTTEAGVAQATYTDLSFNSSVVLYGTQDVPDCVTLTDVEADSEEGLIFEGQVVKFVATKAGKYTLNLISKTNANYFVRVIITVSEKPDVSAMFADGAAYECTIKSPSEAKTTVTFANDGDWKEGTFTVEVDDNKSCVFSYEYDEESGEITCAYLSGATDPDNRTEVNRYDFSLRFNEAYKLELVHPTGFVDETEEGLKLYYESRVLEVKQEEQAQ